MEKVNNKISQRQLNAITNFLSSSSIEETCRKSKISRATFYTWLADEAFRALLEKKRKEVVKEALDKLKLSVSKAVNVLIELMSSDNESTRRQAAEDILDYTLKNVEREDVEERLDKIEKVILENKN